MSKRATRIPAPLPRLVPSIIRSLGPRLLLVATGCAALLILGGGSYILAHSTLAPAPPAPKTAPATKATAHTEKVLGATTETSTSTTTTPQSTAPTPAAQPATTPTAPNSAQPAAVKASFDLVVDPSQITQGVAGTISVPFSVVRHGAVTGTIVPSDVTVYSGGSLTNLITLQSETMQSPDRGVVTLLPIGLFPRDIVVQLSAKAGTLTAGTTFSYHINL